jgi:hypothetical protein
MTYTCEGLDLLVVKVVLSQQDLNASLDAEGAEKQHLELKTNLLSKHNINIQNLSSGFGSILLQVRYDDIGNSRIVNFCMYRKWYIRYPTYLS